MRKREIFWFIGTVIIILIVSTLLFGFEGLIQQNTILDLNFYDTYFVLESRNVF